MEQPPESSSASPGAPTPEVSSSRPVVQFHPRHRGCPRFERGNPAAPEQADPVQVPDHNYRIMGQWTASHPGKKIAFIVGLDQDLSGETKVLLQPAVDVPGFSHDFPEQVTAPDDFRDEVKLLLSNFERKMRLDEKHSRERREQLALRQLAISDLDSQFFKARAKLERWHKASLTRELWFHEGLAKGLEDRHNAERLGLND